MEDIQVKYGGSITALAAVIVMILAKFGFNVTAGDIATVAFGVVALIGIIKQMRDHTIAVGKANATIGRMRGR